MGRKILVVSKKREEVDYSVKVSKDESKITVRHSKSEIWDDSVRGKKCATLVDTGDTVEIQVNDKHISLDHAQFIVLSVLFGIKLDIDPDL